MKTVALFGGSFDPPHIGHIEIVKKLQALPFIDDIVIMPTYLNPFKTKFHTSPQVRLHWLEKLYKDNPKVIVSDFEVKQARKVPTYESVLYLQKKYDKIYIVIGADNIKTLHKWYNYEKLIQIATFIVAKRKGFEIPEDFLTIEVDINISSTQLREHMEKRFLPPKIANEILKEYNGTKNK